MKNFVLKNGDAIVSYGAWICSIIVTLVCGGHFIYFADIAYKADNHSAILLLFCLSSFFWVIGMLWVVTTFYFLYSFIDMRNNLNDIKNVLVYNGGNINLSTPNNQFQSQVKNEYTKSYQSLKNTESSNKSESVKKSESSEQVILKDQNTESQKSKQDKEDLSHSISSFCKNLE